MYEFILKWLFLSWALSLDYCYCSHLKSLNIDSHVQVHLDYTFGMIPGASTLHSCADAMAGNPHRDLICKVWARRRFQPIPPCSWLHGTHSVRLLSCQMPG